MPFARGEVVAVRDDTGAENCRRLCCVASEISATPSRLD